MENFIHPLEAISALGFKCFRTTTRDSRNKKFYYTFTHSMKYGTIVVVGYPSLGKSLNHVVEFYKLG